MPFYACSTCILLMPHSQQNFAVVTGYFVPHSWQKLANLRLPLGVLSSLSDNCLDDGRTTPTAVGLVCGPPKSSIFNSLFRFVGLIGFSSKSKTSRFVTSRCLPLWRPLDPADPASVFLSGNIDGFSVFFRSRNQAGASFLLKENHCHQSSSSSPIIINPNHK